MSEDVELVKIDWIDGMTGYYAGSDGRIYSSKNGKWGDDATPRPLASAVLKNKYAAVAPRINGKNKTYTVHSLVNRAFNGAPTKGQETRHLDGNRTNNVPSNLAWGTRTENMADTVAAGRVQRGSRHKGSKLTEENVLWIRKNHGSVSTKEIAERFGVSKLTVARVARKQEWAWLTDEEETA